VRWKRNRATHLSDGVVVQACQVRLCDITAVACLAAGDQVVAVVQLIVGVPAAAVAAATAAVHMSACAVGTGGRACAHVLTVGHCVLGALWCLACSMGAHCGAL
jgi:hypothetical protein